MHLFLTSSPCTESPLETQLPFILNPANRFVEYLRNCGFAHRPGVLVCADPDAHAHNDRMLREFGDALAWAGMPLSRFTVLDSRNPGQSLSCIQDAAFVMLAGGHVPTQNRFLHAVGLKAAMHDFNGTVVGISAGSMNAAQTVYAQPEETGESLDPDYDRFPEGLGLTRIQVLPHLNMVRNTMLDGRRLFEDITFPDSHGHTFLAIPDGSFVYADGNHTLLCGEGWQIRDGRMTQLTSDGQETVLEG